MIKVCDKTFEVESIEPFLNDLYANAGLELPENFDPVEEVIRVVTVLREQGKNENIN
jgi:hypothetical protein